MSNSKEQQNDDNLSSDPGTESKPTPRRSARLLARSQASEQKNLSEDKIAELDENCFHVVPDEDTQKKSPAGEVTIPGTEANLTMPYDGARDFRDLRISLNMPGDPLPELKPTWLDNLLIGSKTPIDLMMKDEKNESELLRIFTDFWRQILDRNEIPGLDHKVVLHGFLKKCLDLPDSDLSFSTIVSSRLDKLLDTLVTKAKTVREDDISFKVIGKMAELLERKWRRCFTSRLFAISDQRKMILTGSDGLLRDIWWSPYASGSPNLFARLPEKQRIRDFGPGHWWLHCACAYRDGIVDNLKGTFTENALGTPTLYLSRGTESIPSQSGLTRYIHEGPIGEMQLPLLSHLDRKIKLLRSYQLKSLVAPRAGIRYDGFYFVRTYGHKRLSPETELFRLELVLERAPDQRPLSELIHIPLPSQMDDWELYMQLIDDDVRRRSHPVNYATWRREQFQEHKEREEWLHHQKFLESVISRKWFSLRH